MSVLKKSFKKINLDFLNENEIKIMEGVLKKSNHIPPTLRRYLASYGLCVG